MKLTKQQLKKIIKEVLEAVLSEEDEEEETWSAEQDSIERDSAAMNYDDLYDLRTGVVKALHADEGFCPGIAQGDENCWITDIILHELDPPPTAGSAGRSFNDLATEYIKTLKQTLSQYSGLTFEDLGIKVDIPGIDLGND